MTALKLILDFFKNNIRFFNTIRHLRSIQIYYRIKKELKKILNVNCTVKINLSPKNIIWKNRLFNSKCLLGPSHFSFLNQERKFSEKIDWDFQSYGKLWTYNLNYFDFLNQKGVSKDNGLALIYNYIENSSKTKVGIEPYPVSIRIMNWIKFISNHQIKDGCIDEILSKHLLLLYKNLEYHLLGNHLLENGFALLFGAYYFRNEAIYKKSRRILESELNEQILNDGAHFELSPMYHQLLLIRVLDCINLIGNNPWKKDNLLEMMNEKACKMLGWLDRVTYRNGEIPLVNDSAFGIALCSEQIFDYADYLNLEIRDSKLSDSGYRKWNDDCSEIFMDLGQIGPDYIPGHAHADSFNFEFHHKGKPIIVDTGISTYEKNSRRHIERSTESHNTIRLDGKNSSDVWGGFRVGRRAKIVAFKEGKNKITATHDGYKIIGALHTRSFKKLDYKIIIEDTVESKKSHKIESFLHFHPDCSINIEENIAKINSEITIVFKNHRDLTIEEYDFPLGYNRTTTAFKIRTITEKESKIELSYGN